MANKPNQSFGENFDPQAYLEAMPKPDASYTLAEWCGWINKQIGVNRGDNTLIESHNIAKGLYAAAKAIEDQVAKERAEAEKRDNDAANGGGTGNLSLDPQEQSFLIHNLEGMLPGR